MAFTVTARQSGTNGATSANNLVTGSATPTANSLFLVAYGGEVDAFGTVNLPEMNAPTGGSLTYTLVDRDGDATTAGYLWGTSNGFWTGGALYRAAIGGSPSAFTVTVDADATANVYHSVVCLDITGHNAASPIVQNKHAGARVNPESDTASGSITLTSTPTAGNLIVLTISAGADGGGVPATPTAGAGKTFTALSNNQTGGSCTTTVWYRVADGAESTTITSTDLGTQVGNWVMVAAEIAATGGGGNNWAQTPSDTEGLTDSVVASRGIGQSAADTLGLTDSVIVEKVLAQTPADTIGLTDSVTVTLARAQLPTDTEGLTDSIAMVQSKVRSDTMGLSDSVTVVGPQRYVTAISGNGRYFVDQNGVPMLVRAESPWAMFTKLSSSEMDTYLTNRQGYGCNLALVSMIGAVANGGPADTGATYDGVLPFTGGDPTVFNSTYWARMDSYIAKARDRGITLMIYPMDGWNTTFGSVVFNPGSISNSQCQTYGQTLATRYLSYPNIIWSFGGDYNEDATINARYNACLTGIRAAGDTRAVTIQLLYEKSLSDDSTFWEPKVDFNFVYTYYVTYKGVSDGYNHTWSGAPTTRPAVFGEGAYENSGSPHFGTDAALRRQACWALTSGSPGEFTGQEGVWNFQSGWASLLDTTAAVQMKAIRDTFEHVAWWTLVPDDANQLVTAGRGTRITTDSATFPTSNNYVTAGRAADGSLAVIYLPNASSAITVDMTKIGANPTATWVDPTTGGTVSATPGSSYSRGNNAAGDSDWLLLLTGDAGTAWTQTPADTEGLTDSVALTQSKVFTDALGLTDSVTVAVTRAQTVTDTEGLTDAVAMDLGRGVSDTEGLTDSIAMAVNAVYAEMLGLTDSVQVQLSSAGSLTITDAEGLTDTVILDQAHVFADALGLTDSVLVEKILAQAPVDTLGLSDQVTISRTFAPTDTLTLTDTATPVWTGIRAVADLMGLTDSVNVFVFGPRTVTINIRGREGVTRAAGREGTTSASGREAGAP